MILSVSRRTDIPAFYSDWFYNRVKDGYALVRNPKNPKQISKVLINPEVCDCIVFGTKNPAPMLGRLNEIKDYPYYFHFTLNSYSLDIEAAVPRKKYLIDTFQKLADKIGVHRVIWRYKPVFFTNSIDFDYHIKYFEGIAKHLSGYTKACKIGFIKKYKKTVQNMQPFGMRALDDNEILQIAKSFVEIGKMYNIEVQTCTAKYNIENVGVRPQKCTDDALIETILGHKIIAPKYKYYSDMCHCIDSIDIGEYATCAHSCHYCFANISQTEVQKNKVKHIPTSLVLIGELTEEELANVKNRKCMSFKQPAGCSSDASAMLLAF